MPMPIFKMVDALTKLNAVDLLFIRGLRTNFNEDQFFARIGVSDLGFIIRVSRESNYFKDLCEQDKYKKLWDIVYSQIGLHLTSSAETPLSFFVHDNPNLDSFSLVKGAYLFYISDLLRKELKQDYSTTEIRLLKEALPLRSIHATQRYNEIIFHKIANDKLEDDEDKASLFKEAIANCKQQLELHGSYAYMMLAEAYFQYANWAYSQDQTNLAKKSIEAAITSCTLAEKHLEKSAYSIYNASFGRGLALSNSFNIESPQEAKTFLQNWIENQAALLAPRM
jgi:hypothetical protein